jgi:hypothetical protein
MENQSQNQVTQNLLNIAEFMQCPVRFMKLQEFMLYYHNKALEGDQDAQQLVDIARHFGGLCHYVDKKYKA